MRHLVIMTEHMMELVIVSLCFIGLVTAQKPVVETSSGKSKGSYFTVPGLEGRGMSFLGIPYAEPPVGDLRFEPPKLIKPWSGEYDATEFGPMCPQDPSLFLFTTQLVWKLNFTGDPPIPVSEDCLTLDVYTANLTASRPVMVFIHGGGFRIGSSRFYDGKYLSIKQEMVMVFIQFRVGALGFFATSDGTVKGNMAFKDQVVALKWVRDNIANFGGDPKKVTIYGQDVGSFSVSLHLVSPMSKGLFQNAILQSGSNIKSNLFAPPMDLVGTGRWLADVIGCHNATDDLLVSCLHSLDHSAFWKLTPPNDNLPFVTSPTVDGEFLTDTPEKLLQQGDYNKEVNVMGGCMEYEGYLLSILINASYFGPKLETSPFKSTLKNNLMARYIAPNQPDKWETVLKTILDEYSINLEEGILNKNVAKMVGDVIFCAHTYQTMKLLSEKLSGNVYFYEFQQRPSLSKRPEYIKGGAHRDDTFYMGRASSKSIMGHTISPTEDDLIMDEIMINYWTKFAETGTPNGNNQSVWPSLKENEGYMNLKVPPVGAHMYRSRFMNFWSEDVPKMLSDKPSGTMINKAKIYIFVCLFCAFMS